MDKLSQLVASRLASKQKRETDHPDSNSLAAFAEGSLSSFERTAMLAHLATCPHCREVLAYSSTSSSSKPQNSWQLWGRWIAATAALFVVTTALWHWAPAPKHSTPPSPEHPSPSTTSKPKSPVTGRQFRPDLISSPIFQPRPTIGRSFGDEAESLWQLGNASGQPGTLRKSTDGGSTWQSVFIDAQAHLDALSVNGSEIWVGGSNGALFHSPDEGLHWASVGVGNEKMRLKETITQIDMHNGVVTVRTSSASRWSTDDGGSHWRLN